MFLDKDSINNKCGASKIPDSYTTDTGATEVASLNLCLKFLAAEVVHVKWKKLSG